MGKSKEKKVFKPYSLDYMEAELLTKMKNNVKLPKYFHYNLNENGILN